MKRFFLPCIVLLFLSVAGCSMVGAGRDPNHTSEPLTYAREHYARIAARYDPAGGFPRTTNPDGTWKMVRSNDWTAGFFPGTLWYLYEYSKDPVLRAQAERWTAAMEKEKNNAGTHDLGFMIFSPFGNGYRLTNNEAYKDVILQASKTLASRYSPKTKVIKSWDFVPAAPAYAWKYPVIIDNMMNLEMLFWAAKNGGGQELYDIARQHAITSAAAHVRADGSTYHVVDFDPESGKVLKSMTHQGYADESAWSRGQAWALYGFTVTYRETRDPQFLEVAQKTADFFVENLPADHVPFWDFRAPNIPNEERDASAGAVAASGLLELSTLVPDRTDAARYRDTARNIVEALSRPPYLTRGTTSEAILLHSVGSKPGKFEVDMPLSYADYYFVEALMRLRAMK